MKISSSKVCLKPYTWVKMPINNEKIGARGIMVIVVGNGHDDTSSNPGRNWLHFTLH